MPGAPWLLRTCFRARCRFARSSTRASNVWLAIDSGASRSPAAGSSRGSATAGLRRSSDAFPPLFTRGLRLPSFGPSSGASQPTMPFADFCLPSSSALASPCSRTVNSLAQTTGRSPRVRHVTFAAQAPDLQSAPQPQMEGFAVTCPLAPDAPRLGSGSCTSPRDFGFDFLQTPPRGDALAVSLAFGSAKTWLSDFHRHSYVPCLAHTFDISGVPKARPLDGRVRFHHENDRLPPRLMT